MFPAGQQSIQRNVVHGRNIQWHPVYQGKTDGKKNLDQKAECQCEQHCVPGTRSGCLYVFLALFLSSRIIIPDVPAEAHDKQLAYHGDSDDDRNQVAGNEHGPLFPMDLPHGTTSSVVRVDTTIGCVLHPSSRRDDVLFTGSGNGPCQSKPWRTW